MAVFTPEAAAKFAALVERRNGVLDQPVEAYLRRANAEPADTQAYFALARWLRLRDISKVSVRSVFVNSVTQAYFILYDAEVVEVITRTGYRRTIAKRWQYVGGLAPDGGRDGERFNAAMKFKRPKRVGGGLMRGKATPRTKKLPIVSTHSLRPVKGY